MYLKSASIYLFFNLSSAVVPILALPLLTRYLTPSDYGIFTTFTVVSMFFGNLFRLEINMALKREYVDNSDDFSPYISTTVVFSTIMLVIYLLAVLLIMPFIETFYSIPAYWLFLIVLLAYFRFQIINLHHLWQITNRALPYGVWGLAGVLSTYFLAILLIIYNSASWESRALAEWSIGLLSFPIALYYLRKTYGLTWTFSSLILKRMLNYSLPLLPTTVMGYFFMVSDRMFITEINGLYVLGLYSVALQLASSVDLLFKAIIPPWESWIFTKLGAVNEKTIKSILYKLSGIGLGGVCMAVLLPPILQFVMPYLTDKSFLAAEIYIAPCILSVICSGIFRITKTPLIFLRRTSTVAYINILMIIINFLSMYFFVAKWGGVGAAYALALTFICGSLLQVFFTFKYKDKTCLIE